MTKTYIQTLNCDSWSARSARYTTNSLKLCSAADWHGTCETCSRSTSCSLDKMPPITRKLETARTASRCSCGLKNSQQSVCNAYASFNLYKVWRLSVGRFSTSIVQCCKNLFLTCSTMRVAFRLIPLQSRLAHFKLKQTQLFSAPIYRSSFRVLSSSSKSTVQGGMESGTAAIKVLLFLSRNVILPACSTYSKKHTF
jgi:hypothetical protein